MILIRERTEISRPRRGTSATPTFKNSNEDVKNNTASSDSNKAYSIEDLLH